ncbi:MAG: hypothetical protein HZY76_16940 [Anaerolineae bacterium]|nr:MAG: hypothetical protein HZY76_16940 [Anaerolineae bacterium]
MVTDPASARRPSPGLRPVDRAIGRDQKVVGDARFALGDLNLGNALGQDVAA